MKKYNVWARIKGSNFPYVTTEITAQSIKGVIKWLQENNYEYQNKPYKAK